MGFQTLQQHSVGYEERYGAIEIVIVNIEIFYVIVRVSQLWVLEDTQIGATKVPQWVLLPRASQKATIEVDRNIIKEWPVNVTYIDCVLDYCNEPLR